jgi:hypothetical protein
MLSRGETAEASGPAPGRTALNDWTVVARELNQLAKPSQCTERFTGMSNLMLRFPVETV